MNSPARCTISLIIMGINILIYGIYLVRLKKKIDYVVHTSTPDGYDEDEIYISKRTL